MDVLLNKVLNLLWLYRAKLLKIAEESKKEIFNKYFLLFVSNIWAK